MCVAAGVMEEIFLSSVTEAEDIEDPRFNEEGSEMKQRGGDTERIDTHRRYKYSNLCVRK